MNTDETTQDPGRRRWDWVLPGGLEGHLELVPVGDQIAVTFVQRQADGTEGLDQSMIAPEEVEGLIHVTGVALRGLGVEMRETTGER